MSKPKDERYTVAVDFDGVIHSYSSPWINAHTIPDQPVDGAIEWLNEIERDFDVVVFTTRASTIEGQMAVREWLFRYGFQSGNYKVTSNKPPALIYLDDRAMRFEGPGTFPNAREIHKAIPWNKLPHALR